MENPNPNNHRLSHGVPAPSGETRLDDARLDEARAIWGVLTAPELAETCGGQTVARDLVAGIVPERSLNLLIGDPGLGKSPLAYQLAICVASGTTFLDLEVRRARVLYIDFENGQWEIKELIRRLASYAGIHTLPQELMLWNIHDHPLQAAPSKRYGEMIRDLEPGLVIVDPLTAMDPECENKNSEATRFYQELRRIMNDIGCAFLGLHHRRKPERARAEQEPSLEDSFHIWFRQARGAGVLVNGADTRVGIERAPRAGGRDDVALFARGYMRLRGEIPRLYLARAFNNNGEPVGYRNVRGVGLLRNSDQEDAFAELPQKFTFKDAKRIYARQDQATSDFLKKCIALGILRKTDDGMREPIHRSERSIP